MPLVSYTSNSLSFWHYASLSTCDQNLEKNGVTGKIWEKAGVNLLRDLTDKSVNFSTLAISNIRLLLFFWWRRSINERSPIGEKKIFGH